MSKRISGYYWAIYDNKEWEVVKYDAVEEQWYRHNKDHTFLDWDFDVIKGEPILPPTK